jgi:hypothetical protein
LAELHTEAGWCCYDSGRDGSGHFTRALRLASAAGDTYGVANAAWHAGLTWVRAGYPNDALKLFQLGQLRLSGFMLGTSTLTPLPADDARVPVLAARLNRQSATAYALLEHPQQATRHLAVARDGWAPRDAYERAGADLTTAGILLDLNRLDAAEQFTASAARTYGESHRQGRTTAQLLLAEIHVRAGDPQGLRLAHQAIEGVQDTQSVAARRERLIPLADALHARPGLDFQQLPRIARHSATVRP